MSQHQAKQQRAPGIAFVIFMVLALLLQLMLTVPAGLHENQHHASAAHVVHADAHDHSVPADEPTQHGTGLMHLLSHIGHCLSHGAALCADDAPPVAYARFPAPRWLALPLRADPPLLPLLRPPALS